MFININRPERHATGNSSREGGMAKPNTSRRQLRNGGFAFEHIFEDTLLISDIVRARSGKMDS